jgi:hypothetical protein
MRLFVLLSLLAFPLQQRSLPAASVSGTYDILVCKGACGFDTLENVVVRGFLILEAQPFQPPNAPERPFEVFGARNLLLRMAGPTNACFVLETLERNRTYAGLIPVGFTSWSSDGDTVIIQLYASPDAGHTVTVTLSAQGFRGTGTSSGGGGGAPPLWWQPDLIVGRRTGPANTSTCTKAEEQRAPRE